MKQGASRLSVLASLFSAALLAAPAMSPAASGPSTVDAGPYVGLIGPRLAGDRVVWAQRRPTDADLTFRTARFGGSAKPQRLTSLHGNGLFQARLAATPEIVGVRTFYDSQPKGLESERYDQGVRVFTPGGSQQLFEGCPSGCSPISPVSIDVDGHRLAYEGPATNTVTVADVRSGGRQTIKVAGSRMVRLSGRYLAFDSAGDLVIYDLSSSREAYRVRGAAPYGTSFDVQADGTVVFANESRRAAPAWASPTMPVPHPLSLAARQGYQVMLVGGRVGFTRNARRVRDENELGVAPLAGRARVLRSSVNAGLLDENQAPSSGFDFDGTRLAFARRTCSGAQIEVGTERQLRASRATAMRSCRLKLHRRLAFDNRTLLVWYSCAGLEKECVSPRMAATLAQTERVGGRTFRRGLAIARPIELGGNRGFYAKMLLTGPARRLLAKRPRVRVRLSGRVCDDFSGRERDFCQPRQTVAVSHRYSERAGR